MKKDYLRLRANRDFKSVFENGDFAKGKFLKVGVLKNSLKSNRFGVCIPRVLTKSAVTRNTLNRRTREAFRMNANKI